MKLVRLYKYNYLHNSSFSCDIINENTLTKNNICVSLYNRQGNIIEQKCEIDNKKYYIAASIINPIQYNMLKDNNGVLKKITYDVYGKKHIDDAKISDISHNIIMPNKNKEAILFKIRIPGLDPQDVSIELDKNYFIVKKDENHAIKMHYEQEENNKFALLKTKPVIDEEYFLIYATDSSTVFFISQNLKEKYIMDLYNNIITVLKLENSGELNPFLKYKILDKDIQYDRFNEPIQINGVSTICTTNNALINKYRYKAYDRYIDDYRFINDLEYIDSIILDQDLFIPIEFIREVYIV